MAYRREPRITDRIIAALTCPAGQSEDRVYDARLKGFYVRILPGGTKNWHLLYRANGQQRNLKIGDATAIPPSKAFELAKRALAGVTTGGDPQAARQEARAKDETKFGAVVETYLAEKRGNRRPNTMAQLTLHLQKVFKDLHPLPLHRIEAQDIRDCLEGVPPVAATRARTNLSALFNWAIKRELTARNPVHAVAKPIETEVSRERVLTDSEIAAIWNATGGREEPQFSALVRLLLLTGARRNEIANLKWSEIDLEAGVITLPRGRAKTGEVYEIVLSGAARAIITAQPRREDRDLVFGIGRGGLSGFSNPKKRLDARSGTSGWTLHDLRRTCATRLAQRGVAPHLIERILNHASGGGSEIGKIYNRHHYRPAKAEALEEWAASIARLAGQTAVNVVPLPDRRGRSAEGRP